MRKSKFTEKQIVEILREIEDGAYNVEWPQKSRQKFIQLIKITI
jgi:hypothetical protein